MRALLLFCILAVLFLSAIPTAPAAQAYQQTFDICKTQCITWYYYWGNDGTLEYVMDKCSMGGWDSLKTVAKLGYGVAKGSTSSALGLVQDAIVCAITINAAIAPVFESCERQCASDMYSYGPDLAITDLRYDENAGEIVIEVTNGGNSYTNEIEVDVYVASTTNRDCNMGYGEMFSYYTIPELSPGGARYYEEGLYSKHTKRIPWDAPEGKCSKIRVIVDPEEELPERYFETWGESNNMREEWVIDLPILPYYTIETLEYMQNGDSDDFQLGVLIKNNGEEMGWPSVTVEKCGGGVVGYEETVSIEPGDDTYQDFQLDDLFGGEYYTEKLQCLRVIVEDSNSRVERTIDIPLYSGTVEGTVYDMYGKPVTDATVTVDTGQSDRTDSKGEYKITGVTLMGAHTLTATSPTHEFDGHANVTFSINSSDFASQEGLYITGVDMVLMDRPGSVLIGCPVGGYNFYLDSGFFNYRGGEETIFAELGGIVPGNYTVMVTKNGYTTFVTNIVVESGQEAQVRCDISPMQSYQDDSGVIFSPQANQLWENTLGEGYHMWYARISGDGGIIAVLASNAAQPDPMKLLVFTREGQKLADFVFPYERFDHERGPLNPEMTLSYDGTYILIGNRFVYKKDGTLVSENPEGSVQQPAYISADGGLVCHLNKLYSRGFSEITQDLMSGSGGEQVRCPTSGSGGDSTFFTLGGAVLGACLGSEPGLCRNRFGSDTQIDALDGRGPRCVAESDSGSVVVASYGDSGENDGSQVYYIRDGARVWKKLMPTVDPSSGFSSVLFSRISVTPAGGYVAALSGPKGKTYDLFVYDSQGNDVRGPQPEMDEQWFRFFDARATGTGIYYVKSTKESNIVFGVFGQAGQGHKQTTGGETQLQEWEAGTSSNNGLVAAGLAGAVFTFILGFGAWKMGMLR